MKKNLTRRTFLKTASALVASGALTWVSDAPLAKAEDAALIIGVDPAETGGDETVVATLGDGEYPFVPYYLPPGAKWAEIPKFGGSDEHED